MEDETPEQPLTQFDKMIGKCLSKVSTKIDQSLAVLKEVYAAMCADDKTALKAWIELLLPLERPHRPGNLRGRLRPELIYELDPDHQFRVTDLPVTTIKNAIEHWDRREEYTPDSMGELGLC